MGHGQAFSGGLHPTSNAGGLNWRRQLHLPSKPSLACRRAKFRRDFFGQGTDGLGKYEDCVRIPLTYIGGTKGDGLICEF